MSLPAAITSSDGILLYGVLVEIGVERGSSSSSVSGSGSDGDVGRRSKRRCGWLE